MIYLIYTNQQRADAGEILRFLTEEKKLAVNYDLKNCSVVQSDGRIAQDSAIILVSNAAVEDEEWQVRVAGLSEEIRIIPVCGTRNTDYTNPEQIPPRIKELNYIRMDGKHLEHIWDSLITEKEFYMVKSMLLLNRSVWVFSNYSEDFLLTDSKAVEQYQELFQKKLQQESNPYFRQELVGITEYLNVSMQYTKRLRWRRIKDYIKRTAIVTAVIVCFVLFWKVLDLRNRLAYTNIVISVGACQEMAPINSIKLVDGITNPYITEDKRTELYQTLSEHLNLNWHNSSVGLNYKWTLNDAQIASDERYIWSANGNGSIAKWDTYTGKIVEKINISAQPLAALKVSEQEKLFVAVDKEGYILKKVNDDPWEKSPRSYEIPFETGIDVVCCEEKNWAVVADTGGALRWFDLQSGIQLIWEAQFDEIFCIELTAAGLEAVVGRDSARYDLYIRTDGTVDEIGIPMNSDSGCSMDIRNGVIVMADSKLQIVTWSRAEPEVKRTTGLVLARPLHLCFLNDQVIVYYDRNAGTHLYDLKRRLDLGSILRKAAVVSSLSASRNTVMAYTFATSECLTENVQALLPADELDRVDVCAVYTEKAMSSEGRIHRASIEGEYMIRVDLHLEDREMMVMIDGGNRFYIGEAQRDHSLAQADGSNSFYYVDKPANFVGRPTVIGIAQDGDVLLIGGSDGSFYELVFTETGDCLRGAHLQVPSHTSIAAIYQTADCYYLEDATGTFWSIRIGCDALTPEGAVTAVRERLHCAATEEIYDGVSKETLKALDVTILPGGGVREWE